MALNTCEMWSKGIKIASFPKKLRKIAQRLGALPPDLHSLRRRGLHPHTPVWVMFELQYTSLLKYFSQFPHFCILIIGLSPLLWTSFWLRANTRPYGLLIFHSTISLPPQKNSFEGSDDVIAWDLWFTPPQSKVLATPMAWASLNCKILWFTSQQIKKLKFYH